MQKIKITSLFALADNAFDDLQEIGKKIIPNDIWSFVIQILATAILVLILAKFLVKPAKKFIKERQEFIQNNIDESIDKNKEAEDKLEMAEKHLKESKEEGKQIVKNAQLTAMNEKKRIVNEGKEEVNHMRDKAYQEIESEKLKMKKEISEEVVDVALLAASKVVSREINDEDNRKIIQDFIKKDKDNG